jgi:hypothetical protein
MEMSQGNSLYSYIKHFYKMENRKVKQVLSMSWHNWEGECVQGQCI